MRCEIYNVTPNRTNLKIPAMSVRKSIRPLDSGKIKTKVISDEKSQGET